MNRYLFLVFFVFLLSGSVFAAITDFAVSPSIRLGETLTITGVSDTPDQLCKFLIKDSNGIAVIRLNDEYTFSDNSFYSEYQILEPPLGEFFRGDDYNAVVTCGTSTVNEIFTVFQPLSVAHPLQQGWSYWFEEANLEAIMLFGAIILLFFFFIIIGAFFFKRMRGE